MPFDLGASLWGFYADVETTAWPSLAVATRAIAELGLNLGVEVWASKRPDDPGPSADEEAELIEAVAGLPFVSVHARLSFWNWNSAHLRQEIDFAARLGARVLVVHPACFGLDRPDGRPDVPEIRRVLDYAGDRAIRVALENTINAMGALDRALDDFGDDPERSNLGICVDVGHAYLSSDAGRHPVRNYLERYAGLLIHLHLHDTAGVRDDHLRPGLGRVDWTDLVRGLDEIGFAGRGVLEVAPAGANPLPWIEEGVRFLAEARKST